MARKRRTTSKIQQLTVEEIRARNRSALTKMEGMCRHSPPCGGICCLDPDVFHTLHSCNDKNCICHSRERFGRSGFT